MIRSVDAEDAEAICNIYNHYIKNTTITFEEHPVSKKEMKNRIARTTLSLPWVVWEENGKTKGYAYASKWKTRSAYRLSVESSIYLQPDFIGNGAGKILYEALISELRNRSLRAVIGGIALPNERSVALHERLGFVKVAQFKAVGRKFDQWVDVGYWELLL